MRANPFKPPSGPISLYVHVPFCERKCNYCAFESHVPSEGERAEYLDMLDAEFCWWNRRVGRLKLATCYIGGGTPTMLSGPMWADLEHSIDRHFDFTEGAEVTVEANPNSLRAEHLLEWRDWRVTRVSLGVQSFDDAELRMLGRLHSSAEAHCAISASLAAGFSVSADFMFGLPSQTFLNWGRTLHDAAHSGLHHISLYQLSLESGTPWGKMDPSRLSDGYAPYRWAQWYLPRRGYSQYEVANFARPGRESRHNINYWREGEYLGCGPGASGYLAGWRYKNTGSFHEYAKMLRSGVCAVVSGERLSVREKAREAAVLALRMTSGIRRSEYTEKYGVGADKYVMETMQKFPRDLYIADDEKIALTKKGMRVANIIWEEIL